MFPALDSMFIKSLTNLYKNGLPAKVHIVSVIAAPEGIRHVKENIAVDHKFWLCAMDERLNEKQYIVPGLGDAGDLAYGSKL